MKLMTISISPEAVIKEKGSELEITLVDIPPTFGDQVTPAYAAQHSKKMTISLQYLKDEIEIDLSVAQKYYISIDEKKED